MVHNYPGQITRPRSVACSQDQHFCRNGLKETAMNRLFTYTL